MIAKTKLVLFLTDLHVGSTSAILPPNFRLTTGVKIEHSQSQEWIWRCWKDFTTNFIPKVVGKDPFTLVTGSDLVEGDHHGTKEIISRDISDHISAAYQIVKPIADKASDTYLIEGTECHTGTTEHSMGKVLNAVPHPNGAAAWQRLPLEVNKTLCVFRHHIGTSSRIPLYATQLGVTLAEEQAQAARVGHRIPRVVVAGHRHTYGVYEDANALCVTGPSWQLLTRFAHKVVTHARPTIGAFFLDWRGLPPGSLPVVRPRLYTLPDEATHA